MGSDLQRAESFDPTWTVILVIEDGGEGSISRSLTRTSVTKVPGKQRVITFTKRRCLVIESPIMRVVGGNSGVG
jgi:hypothetical protein